MTYQRPAYEQVTIAHGENTLMLRPSLRAAVTLEAHFGFRNLLRGLDEGSFTIVSEIILAGSPSRQDAAAFLGRNSGKPLSSFLSALVGPLVEFVMMLQPAPDPKAKPSGGSSKPMPWSEVYGALYESATGWLGWTPETAWNATPTEIDRAFSAHYSKLKAIHGSDEKEQSAPSPDPDAALDRNGLEALRSSILRHGR